MTRMRPIAYGANRLTFQCHHKAVTLLERAFLMLDDLYSQKLLTLTASIAHLGRLDDAEGSATRTSRLCGSVVTADVVLDEGGSVAAFAQDVKACALGQASAAVLGAGVMGASRDEVVKARDGLKALLAGASQTFDDRFADLKVFESVQDYKARHASVMLAFEAAAEAMEKALDARAVSAA